jgi:tripartite-type tricarboxylate transporter receptor subunit TctC
MNPDITPTSTWTMGRRLCAAWLLGLGAMGALWAQDRTPVRLIVPYAAGGPIDVTARVLADKVKDSLGPVIVDNKPGAGGNLGVDLVAKAAPDGKTVGIAAVATHAINPWLFARLPFDAERDFAPIIQWVRVPNVLVMNTETAQRLHIHSVADLIAYAKAHPGRLNFGSGGNGSAGHLAGEMLKKEAGIFAVHIPYNGGHPAQLALLSGQVDFNIDNLASASSNIAAGKLKPLAVTSAQRSVLLPGVPALSETLPNLVIDTWWGLVAPAGTAPEVVQKLHAAFAAALQDADTRSRFGRLMAEPAAGTPAQFGAFMASERRRYEAVVRQSGAKVD